MFRIGHLGDSNDLTLVAMVAGPWKWALKLAGVALAGSGVPLEPASCRPWLQPGWGLAAGTVRAGRATMAP
jgi:hypothetical protein